MATKSKPNPPPTTTTTTTTTAAAAAAINEELAATTELTNNNSKDGTNFIKSVNEIHSLSTVLHAFRCRWDELQKHLNFIQSAMKDLDPLISIHTDLNPPQNVAPPPVQTLVSPPNTDNAAATTTKPPEQSEVEYLCQTMCSRGLRRYIINHLSSDVEKLRGEVTAALKIAPKPAKLVLECVGRFYLQGSKAYTKDSPMIPGRKAAVLVLEFFLLAGCGRGEIEIEASVKEEADLAAVAWRKRLISEGGVSKTNGVDARGLLLFIGSFGVPNAFRIEEIRDLIRLSNVMEISDALRQSPALLAKIPDLIEGMLKNGMKAAAVDIAFTFGLEDKFPPQEILTSFLRESKETWKKIRRESHGTTTVLKEATRKHLAALKSVQKCLEDHKIDPLKFLPECEINEQTINLEKDIADLDKKLLEEKMSKRKLDELEASKLSRVQVEKRTRSTANVSSMTPINLLDGSRSGHGNSYNGASSVAASLPDSILGTMAGSGGGMLAARFGSGLSTGSNGVLSNSSFPGVHRDILVDKVGPYSTNYPSYEWSGTGDAVFSDRLIGQSYARQPASIGNNSLYRPSPSLEGFVGLPNAPSAPSISAANRSSASDLYQFADAIEGESYYSQGSHKSRTANPVIPAQYSSYPF